MKLTTVLFDLDGTLLPMDQEKFISSYLSKMAQWLAPYGYDPDALVKSIWHGTVAMMKNDGAMLNEEVFWATLRRELGERVMADVPHFASFYQTEFDKIQADCGFDARAAQVVAKIKAMGYRVALATSPLFPMMATERRIKWTGLQASDFELVTTFENSRHCKPNPQYYTDVATALGTAPHECLMVGNDLEEDMAASKAVGMHGFLLTECLINRRGLQVEDYPHGDFEDLLAYLKEIQA